MRSSPVWGFDRVGVDEQTLPGADASLVLLNAQYLYPVSGLKRPPPGTTLLHVRHPAQFLPYQYEGYEPHERYVLRIADISMRLVALDVPRAK